MSSRSGDPRFRPEWREGNAGLGDAKSVRSSFTHQEASEERASGFERDRGSVTLKIDSRTAFGKLCKKYGNIKKIEYSITVKINY